MKKFMKKCKKALVIAMTIILVGTSIDTSTLYVRAENATDVTEESGDQQGQLSEVEGIGEQQNQSGEGGESDELQNQPGESEGDEDQQNQPSESEDSDDQQTQTGVIESGEELKNQPGEAEVDYEDLSRLDEEEEASDDDGNSDDTQVQPAEIDLSFLEDLIIDLPEPETSIPPMGFFSLRNGVVTLASGNHAEWIDRIDLSDDTSNSLRTLYNQMEEWTDNDGVEDWLITGEKDKYEIGAIDVDLDVDDVNAALSEALTNYAQYVWAITYAFDRDHPEVFWLGSSSVNCDVAYNSATGGYSMRVYLLLNTTTSSGLRDMRAERYRDVTTLKAAITTMNTNANAILAEAEGLDTVDKIKYFNEKLTTINEYNTIVSSGLDDSNVNRDTWECVSALAGQTGEVGPVCEAYARAFKVLCDRSGIPCILEDGDAGGPHMWNAVQVEGNWYATDVTWNDPTVRGVSGAISGRENEDWLLIGTNTVPAGETEPFSVSHVTQNNPGGTLQFLNGPVLSAEKYVPYVASVKTSTIDEKFESFETAFNVANGAGEGAVLKLLTSVELEKNYTVTGDFIFDLNGYEAVSGYRIELSANSALTISDSSSTQKGKLCGSGLYFIENEGGILTVTGGTVTNIQGDSNFYFLIENKGTLKVTGGVIENVARRGYAIYNSAGKVTVEAGKVTNTGEDGVAIYNDEGEVTVTGTVTIANTGSYGEAIFNNRGEVTVEGGKVTDAGANGCAIYDNGGKVIVNDGQISSSGDVSTTIASVGELIISGGEITNSGTTDCIAIRGNDSVKISNSVVTNCSNKEAILMWGTETNPATLEISGNSTIRNDGTGYAINIQTHDNASITDSFISASDSANFAIYNVGTLTLDGDSTVQGGLETVFNVGTFNVNDGIVKSAKSYSIYNSVSGQLLINGGIVENISATGGGIYNSADASVVITGGTIKSAGSESAIYNYKGSMSISGTPQIVNTGSAPAIVQYGVKLYLSGGATITGDGATADIEVRDDSEVGRITLVGALTNTNGYRVGHIDREEKIVTGVFALAGVNPNSMTATVYTITAEDVAKFTAADTSLQVKQDTTNNQLLLAYKPHVHNVQETFENPWTATNGTVTAGSYYLTEDVTADGVILIEGTVALCLNGHTLDIGTNYIDVMNGAALLVFDCSDTNKGVITGKGYTIVNHGTFTLMNGKIVNTAEVDGTALFNEGGTAIIEAGSLQSMSKYSWGIYNYSGSLMLKGGSIQTLDDGVGVFCANEGRIQLSGAPVMDGGKYDFELGSEAQISITGALTGSDTYTLKYQGEVKNVVATVTDGSYTAEEAKSKFVAAETGFEIVASGQNLIWDYKKHIHQLVLSNSLNGVENAQAVEVSCTNSDGSICELFGNRYYVTIEAPYSLEYDTDEKAAILADNITSNITEATVSPIAYYVKSGSTWTAVSEAVNVGTYKAEVTVTIGNSSKKAVVEFTIAEMSSEGLVDVTPYQGEYDPFAPEGVDAIENITLYHSDLENTATIEYSIDGGSTWSLTVPKMTSAGSMSVTVRVTSPNFTEYKTTVSATMTPYDISYCGIELEQDTYYYTGQQIQPKVTGIIASTGEKLPLTAADYKVTYGENNSLEELGSVSVEATNSNYTKEATIEFGISYYNGEVEILYNGNEPSDNYYNDDVAISAQGYTVSTTLEGPYTESVMLSGEGAWVSMEVYFKQDGTGYIIWPETVQANIDKTAPTFADVLMGIWVEDKKWNTLAEEITYDVYFNEVQYGFIMSLDELSGVDQDQIYYYIDKSGSTTAKTATELDACEFTRVVFEDNTVTGSGTVADPGASADGGIAAGFGGDFILDEDGKYVVYAYVCDFAGNKSEYISTNGIVIDTKVPVVEASVPSKEAGTLKDTSATFTVESDEDATALLQVIYNYSGEELIPMFIPPALPEEFFESFDAYPFGEQVEQDNPEAERSGVIYKVALKAGEAQTFTITGLLPNTEYLYTMVIYDEAYNVSVVGAPADEEYMYDCLTFTTLKTIPTFDEAPTITGTYGDMLSEMSLSQPVSTNGVAGTWTIVYEGAGQRYDMPEVNGTTAYTVEFTPEDTEACETVTVQVVPSVAKMPLTVKIDNQTRVYGEENPELTYTITQGSIVDANDAGKPKLTIELSTEATKTSDVDTYEIIATVTKDDNYAVTVQEGTLTITQADAVIRVEAGKDAYNKVYGDDDFNLSGISTNSDGNISYSVIGESVSVSQIGEVVIRGAGSSTVIVQVPATKNYKASEAVKITITVAKADIDAVNISKNYLYINDAQDTIDLSTYVPVDAGNVTYSVGATSGDCEFAVAPTVDANGKLSYTVKAGAIGESAFFMATVNSDNYKSLVIKVNVTLVDKTPVAEKSGSEVSLKNNTLAYGEALSKLEFNEAVFVAEGTGEVVSGTLAWEEPDYQPNVATTKATWVFTPDDDQYMSVTGELAIVVKKAVQPAFSIEDLGEIEFLPGGTEKTSVTTIGGVEDGEVTISVPANNNVIDLDEDGCFAVLNAGTVTITAVCVDPYGNYEDATATYELTILPYELKAYQIIWEDGVTGAETYDGTAKEPAIWMYMITGSLTEGTEYTVTYVNNIDVYTLTEADAGFDASKAPAVVVTGKGNYTGTVKKYFVINKANASIAVENDTYTKTYGDESFVLSGITKVGDGTLVYTVKDSKNAAGQAVAQDKVLTVDATGKVTIVGAGSAVITVGMAETENYKAAEEVSITVNVAKASYTTEVIERGYAYNKDNADTVDLTEKLPADIQDASFAVSEKEGDASFVVAPAIDTTGKLTYTLKKGAKGQSATLEVLVTSANYKDFYITVELELAYEVLVVLKEGSEVAVVGELTYGDALSKLPFAEAVFVEEGTDIVVEGTLSWETPDAVLEVETTKATWVFTPDNVNYSTVKGTVTIKINKAEQPEFSIVPVTDASYGMEGSVWLETTGGVEGAEITFTVPKDNGVVTDVNKNGLGKFFIVPINSGKVIITAVAVDPEGNYEDAVATYELTVAPASIKADWISWLDGFTGVGTYNGNEITPGVKVYFIAEGNLTEGEDYTVSYVNNTYAYTLKEGDEGFDATKAPAVVVTGKGNYTGSAKVYFVINKAEAAPNMPKSTKTVASHVATAGQVSLPTDWIWQEPNTALTEGGETIVVAVYNGADKGNYVKETVSVTITRMEAGAPYVSEINGEDVEDIENGWQHVSDDLDAAAEGDVITVEMNGVTVLPGNVIDNIKGKNITVELDMGNGVIWTINGKNITATTVEDVDLKVDLNTTNIPVEVINKITGEISTMQISLAHDGDFGYKAFMRINLDAANAGYYAQLFHYEEASKVLKYMNQSKIDAAGYVELPFTHASEYTIVIDDVAYQVPGSGGNGGGSSAPAATPTPAPTQAPPATKLPNTADEFPLEGILLLMMVCMAAFGGTVAYGKCKKAGRK